MSAAPRGRAVRIWWIAALLALVDVALTLILIALARLGCA